MPTRYASDTSYYRGALALTCSNICNGSTTGPQGPEGPQGPSGDVKGVASYYSLTTQSVSDYSVTPGSPTILAFDQTFVERNGITRVGSDMIKVPRRGIYEAWYSLQIHRTSGGSPVYVYIWLNVNGSVLANSNGRIEINSNNGDSLPIVPYILELQANDTIQFVAQADDANVQVLYQSDASVPGPAIPSVIVGIKEVSAFTP